MKSNIVFIESPPPDGVAQAARAHGDDNVNMSHGTTSVRRALAALSRWAQECRRIESEFEQRYGRRLYVE